MRVKPGGNIAGVIFIIIGGLLVLFFGYRTVVGFLEYNKIESTTAKVTSVKYTGTHTETTGSKRHKTRKTYYDYTYGIKYTVDGKEYNNFTNESYTTKNS